jgi:anti-anti-sigma regulatory factor
MDVKQNSRLQIYGPYLATTNAGATQMRIVNIEKLGELRVVECDGRIVRSEAAFALRDGITSQSDARVIVLDLSEVNAIEGGGLGMLMFLQRWAQNHGIRLTLFNPRIAVRARLESSNPAATLDILSLEELLDLLGRADHGYPLAA